MITLERILSRENMVRAYKQVVRNKGCAGVDGLTVDDLHSFLRDHWAEIKASIARGSYYPQPVLGKEIDKPKGGKRLRTRIVNLKRLGVPEWLAIKWGLNRKGGWHIVNTPILKTTITLERLKSKGFLPMSDIYAKYCYV